MFSTGKKPPTYPRQTVKATNNSSSKVASRLRRTVANYKKMSEEELQREIKQQSIEMGLYNEDPNIPDNVLNQLAEENQKFKKGSKGGSRRKTYHKKSNKRKSRKN